MSFCDNFMGFWNQWKHNIITHDYTLLDKIHPGRIWTAELWIAKRGTTGEGAPGGSLWDRLQPDADVDRRDRGAGRRHRIGG